MINIDNYELYAMDYLDNNLDKMTKKKMDTFLRLYPHIAQEIKDINELKITDKHTRELTTDFKMSLMKNEIIEVENISEESYESIFIAQVEGDLNKQEDEDLALFLNENPSLKPELILQQSTILQADKNIIFENKDLLKKKSQIIILWPAIATIAALLLLSFWIFEPQQTNRTPFLLTKVKTKTIQQISYTTHTVKLKDNRKSAYMANVIIEETILLHPIINLDKLSTIPAGQLAIEDNDWQKEMLLRQSFAYYRNELSIDIDYSELKKDKRSVMKMISSLLWETTKGQIKNMKDELVNDNMNRLQAKNIEGWTNGFIAVKTPKKTNGKKMIQAE